MCEDGKSDSPVISIFQRCRASGRPDVHDGMICQNPLFLALRISNDQMRCTCCVAFTFTCAAGVPDPEGRISGRSRPMAV